MNERELELYALLMEQGKVEEAEQLRANANNAEWESLG
jgi:hypothetical protein